MVSKQTVFAVPDGQDTASRTSATRYTELRDSISDLNSVLVSDTEPDIHDRSRRGSVMTAIHPEEVDPAETKPPEASASVLGSFFNMTNAIVGAGMIGLPFAFSEAGFFTGILLLLSLGYITDWTLRLLAYSTKLSGRNTYQELVCFCFGRLGFHLISFSQFVFAFGGMCAFNVIIGDTIPHVLRAIFPTIYNSPVLLFLTSRQVLITLITLCISYPLSLYRDMGKLAKTSALALVAMVIIVTAVIVEAPKAPPEARGSQEGKWSFIRPDVFQAIAVMGFAFVCHHNSFMIYSSLRTPTLNRYARVIHLSAIISVSVCVIMASVGYLNFTDKTKSNILNNFSDTNVFINVARFCFGFNMITTYPMEAFVAREVIEGYVSYFRSTPASAFKRPNPQQYARLADGVELDSDPVELHSSETLAASNSSREGADMPSFQFMHDEIDLAPAPFSRVRHVAVTTAMMLASLLISLLTCDLGIVIEITGGISATALAFILPSACYLRLASGSKWTLAKLPLWALLVFGLVVLLLSPAMAVYRLIHSDNSERHTC
ncbi:hypothetical protein H4R34_002246 [Dimargaris verticillata]|uniref:Amino acid transporter transmembrane domain-containing protein n=1 Tax=Dimargaris verticillata TaxID=2761393 RepID=A0A9W8EA56_9FUNG|nr:hypothetical protein H4R34_002246 [Dimargaris verticillata]